jgi:hypothetical protein
MGISTARANAAGDLPLPPCRSGVLGLKTCLRVERCRLVFRPVRGTGSGDRFGG